MIILSTIALAVPLSHDQAEADVWHLARLLEQSHPDPFLHGGGRVAFYQAVDEAIRGLPDGEIEPAALHEHLLPIVARVGDGHTTLAPVAADTEPVPLGLQLTPVGDALVVSGVSHPDDKALLGMRVESVAGLEIAGLLDRQDRLVGSDNEMHRRTRLVKRLETGVGRASLLQTEAPPTLQLVGLDGNHTDYRPPPPTDTTDWIHAPTVWTLPEPGPHDMAWTLLDDDTAYLRIASMMRYREAFEVWRATGFEANLGDYLDRVASKATRRLARDRDARIEQVPSATETFQDLFRAMERKGADTLIVDLRGNGGGNSVLSMVLGLFLADEPELVRLAFEEDGYQLRRYSELFHVAHRNAARPPGVPDGSYDFRVLHDASSPAEHLQQLEQYLEAMPTVKAAHDDSPLFVGDRPDLKVLVDAGTYSAGFDLVRLLEGMGAETVGVPSSQSGNCFIDSVPFHLQHSRLKGSMSTKWSVAYPDDPEKGTLLPMDTPLTWERWGAEGFDPHAVVTLAIEDRE